LYQQNSKPASAMKFTAAFLVAAHAAAKANAANLPYRQRLSIAMKAAYAAAKTQVVCFDITSRAKGFLNTPTTSQTQRLVEAGIGLTAEQISTFVLAREAKEMIALLDAKQQVRAVLAPYVAPNAIETALWGDLRKAA
jgi:hypothetical protein